MTNEDIPKISPLFSFDPDPTTRHTVWTILFGATFNWVAIYGRFQASSIEICLSKIRVGFNQAQVQRYLCVPTIRAAKLFVEAPLKVFLIMLYSRALYFNLVGLLCILSLCCGVGLVIFAKYYACDPVKLGLIKQTDQVCQISYIETRQ